MTTIPAGALSSPATQRNREPILAVLRDRLKPGCNVLEIAAGAGEHAAHLAAALPSVNWRPSDPDATARRSIAAWRAQLALPNLLEPVDLDASRPDEWPVRGG